MRQRDACLPAIGGLISESRPPYIAASHPKYPLNCEDWGTLRIGRLMRLGIAQLTMASLLLAGTGYGQGVSSRLSSAPIQAVDPDPPAPNQPNSLGPGSSRESSLGVSSSEPTPDHAASSQPTPAEPAIQPVVEEPSEIAPDIALDPASLVPDPRPLPVAKATLIGGTLTRLDRLQDQLTIQVFGGGKIKASFDPRSQVYRDGQPATLAELKPGDRIYIDTILDGNVVFARNINLRTTATPGESQGVILSYRPDRGELELRDRISPQPVRLQITPETQIVKGDQKVSLNDLSSGALVSVRFGNGPNGRLIAERVTILAAQGASFTFVGTVTFVDLRMNLLVLTSTTDHKTYELQLDRSLSIDQSLRQGAQVTAIARYEGNQYVAHSLSVDFPAK
jgi:hypothetical protein